MLTNVKFLGRIIHEIPLQIICQWTVADSPIIIENMETLPIDKFSVSTGVSLIPCSYLQITQNHP